MTRNPRRAAVALVLALACLAALLYMSGCASFRPEYTWVKTEAASADYEWIKVAWDTMYTVCGRDPAVMANLGGCAFNDPGRLCRVFSFLGEEEAKLRLSGDGLTLFEHELKHCEGWRHQ